MILLLMVAALIMISGFATQYVINVWAPLIKSHPNQISLLRATLLGLFVSAFTIPAAIITRTIQKLK